MADIAAPTPELEAAAEAFLKAQPVETDDEADDAANEAEAAAEIEKGKVEAKTEPKTEPVKTEEPAKEDPAVSKGLLAVAREKKVVDEANKALKADRLKFEAERKEHGDYKAKYEATISKFKADPLGFMREHGYSDEDAVQAAKAVFAEVSGRPEFKEQAAKSKKERQALAEIEKIRAEAEATCKELETLKEQREQEAAAKAVAEKADAYRDSIGTYATTKDAAGKAPLDACPLLVAVLKEEGLDLKASLYETADIMIREEDLQAVPTPAEVLAFAEKRLTTKLSKKYQEYLLKQETQQDKQDPKNKTQKAEEKKPAPTKTLTSEHGSRTSRSAGEKTEEDLEREALVALQTGNFDL